MLIPPANLEFELPQSVDQAAANLRAAKVNRPRVKRTFAEERVVVEQDYRTDTFNVGLERVGVGRNLVYMVSLSAGGPGRSLIVARRRSSAIVWMLGGYALVACGLVSAAVTALLGDDVTTVFACLVFFSGVGAIWLASLNVSCLEPSRLLELAAPVT
jgi:hypothetical protein